MIYQQGVSTRHLVVLSILLALSLLGETNNSCLGSLKNLYKLAEHQASSSLEAYETVFNLSPSTEETCQDIPKHVIDVSDIKETLKSLYCWNTFYNYHLVEVRHNHKDLSYPNDLREKLKDLNGTMFRTSENMIRAAPSITFEQPLNLSKVINDSDHAKKIYGGCVLYRIKNLLKEGNPIVQSLKMTDVCKKRNRRRVPTQRSTCC
ncbi:uncharacterized protein LOC134012003 [Osmerus eperlanus]|uniref:uncharacterized protein LOC134012003 n=1 Tax=Osmerus eperlanus TaxID=29151 RepID=UPI002E0FB1FD